MKPAASSGSCRLPRGLCLWSRGRPSLCQGLLTQSLSRIPDRRDWVMGWSTDYSEGHEGWAASVTPDGRHTGSSTGRGMLVEGITGRYERDTTMPEYEVVPHREIIGWQGQCECGWQGQFWERVPSAG